MKLPRLNGRGEQKPFFDLIDNNVYVNLTDTLYAMPGKATYHPFLFRAVAEYLEQKQDKSMYDYVILMQIQNMKVLSIDAMRTYITAVDCKEQKNLDRKDFFKSFTNCLKKKEEKKISSEDKRESELSKPRYNGPKGMLL